MNIRLFLIVLVVFFSVNYVSQAQKLKLGEPVTKATFAEKIYLQLTSNIYTTDDIIWFKAVVTSAFDHRLTNRSGILYVELIDSEKNVLSKKTLKLNKGIADSFFQLGENYQSGRYLIRAYTEWNKNFDKNFIFKQYINLYNPNKTYLDSDPIKDITLTDLGDHQFLLAANIFPEVIEEAYINDLKVYFNSEDSIDSLELKRNKDGHYAFNYILPLGTTQTQLKIKLNDTKSKNFKTSKESTYTKTIVVDKDYLDVQFFPESGKLVEGLTSKVAFKGIDYNGLGKQVSGELVDESDNTIVPFSSNHLGMGFVKLTPGKHKTYYGKIKTQEGLIYKYPLPEVENIGYVLTLNEIMDHILVRVESNHKSNDSLLIQTTCRGILYHNLEYKLNNGVVEFFIESETLPEGIIDFSVLNKDKIPLCERLIFNSNTNNQLQITAKNDRSSYSQRDRTKLDIAVTDYENKPVDANLSFLVIDKNQLGDAHKLQETMASYFLLNSELRGTIETPGYYFNPENKFRTRDLDALMLTQGWSQYIYNDKRTTNHNFKVEPETDLVVSGTIGEFSNASNKRDKEVDLTMLTFGDPGGVYSKEVDSTGRFSFYLGDVYKENLEILIQTANNKGKTKDYTINIDRKNPPEVVYEKNDNIHLANTIINDYLQNSKAQSQTETDFILSDNTIRLKEVELSGYKLTPEREKMMELHGKPDVVIEHKELQEKIKKWSFGLYSLLMYNYPGEINIRRVESEEEGNYLFAEVVAADYTYYIIDGIPVKPYEFHLLPNLPPEEIKSVEIIKHPKNKAKYFFDINRNPLEYPGGDDAFIVIYTNSKKGLFGVQETKGIFKGVVSGFSPMREFYAPKYENITNQDWQISDTRAVIHWAPTITTNKGKAQVDFYNADATGDMLLIVEGITDDGKIGYYESTYTVDEKLEK